jgi:hypothetical protein
MIVQRVHRVINPRRRKASKSTRANNARKRKQPSTERHCARKSNPAQMVTLGFLNPKRRTKPVAAHKKAKVRRATNASRRHHHNPRRRSHNTRHRRRNATRVYVMAPRRRHNRRSRNPFGQSPTKVAQDVGGIIIGATAVTMIDPMLPSTLTSSTIMRLVADVVISLGAGWIGGMVSKDFGFNVMLGGLAVAGSKALATAVPSLNTGFSGLGDFVPGKFVVPQNPVTDAFSSLPTQGALMSSAYPAAYGRSAA